MASLAVWRGKASAKASCRSLLSQYGKALFEPRELIILVHLSRAAIDDAVVLDVFPPPKKLVRTALLVVHGVDPRLQDRARTLVQQLGDQSPKDARNGREQPGRDGAGRVARTRRRPRSTRTLRSSSAPRGCC